MAKARRVKGKFSRNPEKKKSTQSWRESTEQTPVVLENKNFEAYYKGIIPEEEWESFIDSLKAPLPTTFRITGTRKQALEILDAIEKRYVPALANLEIDGEKIEAPTPLAWYPNNFGWHIASSRSVIKKSKEFTKFHCFLVSESEVGNISRQEAVSMVPPLMLDVQPHHWVLDMCAAPGSKTAQLIEALHANDELQVDSKLHIPSGLIVANDSEEKRCYTLVHQIKRLRSPNFIVTNHEAQNFPNLHVDRDGSGNDSKQVRFDRILCDVPCSGDGTMRKNLMIWKDWHVGQGLSLHVLQASILARGIQLLKVGGKLVYSTCSLNPLENEAVVASALNSFSGKIRLVDASHMLPELRRCPGLNSWKVFIKKDEEIQSYDELAAEDKEKKWAAPTLFPPKNAHELGLEKCVRIYPHLQNTGGFFVAVFEKIEATSSNEAKHLKHEIVHSSSPVKDIPAIEEPVPVTLESNEEEKAASAEPNASPKRPSTEALARRNKRPVFSKEEPFIFMAADSPELQNLKSHFILDGFPIDQFLVRSESDKNKTVSFVSKSVCQLLSSRDIYRLKVINTGVKAFQRIGSSRVVDCSFRLQNESLNLILPFLPPSLVVTITPADMKVLLTETTPFIKSLTPAVQEKLTPLEQGTVVIIFDPSSLSEESNQGSEKQPKVLVSPEAASQMAFPLWKANVSVNLLLAKNEQRSLLHRLFGFEE